MMVMIVLFCQRKFYGKRKEADKLEHTNIFIAENILFCLVPIHRKWMEEIIEDGLGFAPCIG